MGYDCSELVIAGVHSVAQQGEMILYWQGEMQVLILQLVCSTDGVRNALGIRNAFCGFRRS